jgi:hypothetical protein
MKKFAAMLLAAMMLLTAMTVLAEEKTVMNWAYGAMPLNNGNVGTIYYTAEEIAAIVGHADPLTLDAATGNFVTAEGTAVASPIK